MRYVYAEDVIGATSALGSCRGCGSFGQSGPYSAAVKKLQIALRAVAQATGNDDYHPGPADGLYGRNTHAALIRVSRDFLEPQGLVSKECRSTCNTLWLRAKSACQECLATILRAISASGQVSVDAGLGASGPLPVSLPGEPDLTLTEAEIAEIADRYGAFLDAYVARYGDGGQLDPAQIARREDVSLEEAERLAAERRAAQEGGGTTPPPTPTQPRRQVQKAGFSWWWILLFAGLGGAAWYAWKKGKRTSSKEVTEYTGLGRRRGLLPPLGG